MPQRTARLDDALDGIFLHPIFGLAILAVLMFLIFQAVFSWATPIMDGIGAGIMALGTLPTQSLPDVALKTLLVAGIFSGLGSVLVFLQPLLVLFLFLLVLQDSG